MFAIPSKKIAACLSAIGACMVLATPAQALTLTYVPDSDNFSKLVDDNGVLSIILTFCVQVDEEPLSFTSGSQEYTLTKDGLAYYGAAKQAALGELFTAFDAYNGATDITKIEKMALQNAVWSITDGVSFTDEYADGVLGHELLADMNSANNAYQVGAYVNTAGFQDYLWLNKTDNSNHVPEPGSLALVGLALGGLGALRRRKPADAALKTTA